jgi:hypothetical protein
LLNIIKIRNSCTRELIWPTRVNGIPVVDVAKRGGSWIGLTDEDVGLLRGVDCNILAPKMGYPGPRLNRINRVFIPTRCIFFFGSLSRKNLQVKRAWLGAIWDG